MVEAVKTFFVTAHMPKHFNSTVVSLIPKELVCGYHKRIGRPRCALKIDIMKAYDTVSWRFLWSVMTALKYPSRFIELIRACVSTAWFSVSVNSSLQGHFKRSRGLRQGDPLYPYLFIIVMDCFTELLQGQKNAATEGSMRLIRNVLKEFGELSGLHPNLSKSTSYFAGVEDGVASRLSSILGIPTAALPVRYLGIPLTTKQINAVDYRILVEKIKQKINEWGGVDNGRYLPKVSWRQATEGGLGIKGIHNWNVALEGIRWPQGRGLTVVITIFKEGFPSRLRDEEDNLIWFSSKEHSSKQVWNSLRDRPENVGWWKLMWFRGQVSKFSFVVWLACLNRLPTKDRL
ncbi:hypothetical protein LIER_18223 [Lithospermum erythrorhizon]|uniref:Reverse transcriptase domain-containing protein n=1 Tax=Lithospermum erythrorhizon TaxID=34254 RepID=A0AAV3QGC8_LITER